MPRIGRITIIVWAVCKIALAQTPPPYWEGAGDTPPMSAYQQMGGYLRFSDYPIQVYLSPYANSEWQQALEASLLEIQQVLPIQRTRQPTTADIFVYIVPQLHTCPNTNHQQGCSRMLPLGSPTKSAFALRSAIWLLASSRLPPQHLMPHELLHALGLLVHSPYPNDALYNGDDTAVVQLSEHDIAALKFLYQQPAIGTNREDTAAPLH